MDPTTKSQQEEYRLHWLCREGTVEEVESFLQQNGNSHIDEYDKKGNAPIHYAVKRETADIEQVLDVLVRHQVSVNTRSLRDGETALHMVVKRFEAEDATTLSLSLLAHAADPDYRDDKYRTVYDIAMAKGMVDLAEYFTADLRPQDAQEELSKYRKKHYGLKLVSAVIEGSMQDIEACITQGADLNQMNEHGAGAIHYTVTHCPLNKLELMQRLIAAGADVNLQDYEGDTALNLAIKTASLYPNDLMYNLTGVLLEHGCDQSLQDIDGKNALQVATEKSYDDIVAVLRSNGRPTRQQEPEEQEDPEQETFDVNDI